jgi:hypothetical protein
MSTFSRKTRTRVANKAWTPSETHRERHRKRVGSNHTQFAEAPAGPSTQAPGGPAGRASPLQRRSRSERAPAAAGLDELAHDRLAVAAARGGEAAHLLRVEAQVVSTADEVREEQVVAWDGLGFRVRVRG